MHRPVSVLVADDEPDAATSLTELFILHGFKAKAASTPLEAIRLVADDPPDAVIMDIKWTGPDGYALAETLCGFTDRRPLLIAVTGMGGYEESSKSAGFDYHFIKPVDPQRLVLVLQEYAQRTTD